MKILLTKEQIDFLNENKKEKVSCVKCDHSWDVKKSDDHPYLCHMCGFDSKTKNYNYDELENFWKNYKKEEVTEKWSEKYKKSIDCSHPKGFSQRAHCQGRKKHLKENNFEKLVLKTNGYDLEKVKKALKILSQISETVGEKIPLEFKLHGYELKRYSDWEKYLILFIDVDGKDGMYNADSSVWYEISQQLLQIFEMIGIRDEKTMRPIYDFRFNKRAMYGIKTV